MSKYDSKEEMLEILPPIRQRDKILNYLLYENQEIKHDISFIKSELERCLSQQQINKKELNTFQISQIMSLLIDESKKKSDIKSVGYLIEQDNTIVNFYLVFDNLTYDIFRYISNLEIEIVRKFRDFKIQIEALDIPEDIPEKVNIFYLKS